MALQSKILHFLSLHTFLILFLFVFGGIFATIFFVVKRKAIALLFFFFPILGFVNMFLGSAWNDNYVGRHGVKGTAVITQIAPTGVMINHTREMKYSTLVKTSQGTTVESAFTNNGQTFYPPTSLFLPPAIGEIFTVKYIPGDETNFVICTDDSSSAYANQLDCIGILKRVESTGAKYHLDSTNAAFRQEYKAAITDLLNAPCDSNLKMTYTIEQQQLGN
jgi:hypothetical protein